MNARGKILTAKGESILIDEEDFPILSRYTWHVSKYGYAKTGIFILRQWTTTQMHRLIMGMQSGMIDHINRNKLDNRKCNLRYVSRAVNVQNQGPRSDSWSKLRGVHRGVKRMSRTKVVANPSKPFVASITFNTKTYYLGTYATGEEAAKAYDRKALEFYGEHAYLNFPESKGEYAAARKSLGESNSPISTGPKIDVLED